MADIKLKNYLGESKPYSGVPKVWLESTESTEEALVLLPFSYGEAVSAEIAADFSEGNMKVAPSEGNLFSELIIPKPPALIPGNVKEGVEIAGVTGTLTAGSGGGAATAEILTGTFDIPGSLVYSSGRISTNGWTINEDGHWQKTISGLLLQPGADPNEWKQYFYSCYTTEFALAREVSSFSGYGHCVVLGNEGLATGDYEFALNSEDQFLIISQLDKNQTTILICRSSIPLNVINDTSYEISSASLVVYAPDGTSALQKITFEHGKTQKPDAVYIMADSRPEYTIGEMTVAAWGLRSSLSGITSDNTVGGYVKGCRCSKTTTMALDFDSTLNDRRFYLYCPDDTTVTMESDFAIGATFRWFAIWGLTAESE